MPPKGGTLSKKTIATRPKRVVRDTSNNSVHQEGNAEDAPEASSSHIFEGVHIPKAELEAMRKAMEEMRVELATLRATKDQEIQATLLPPLPPSPMPSPSSPHNPGPPSPPKKTIISPIKIINPTRKSGNGMSEDIMKAIE